MKHKNAFYKNNNTPTHVPWGCIGLCIIAVLHRYWHICVNQFILFNMRLMLRYSFLRSDYEDHNFSISNNIIFKDFFSS